MFWRQHAESQWKRSSPFGKLLDAAAKSAGSGLLERCCGSGPKPAGERHVQTTRRLMLRGTATTAEASFRLLRLIAIAQQRNGLDCRWLSLPTRLLTRMSRRYCWFEECWKDGMAVENPCRSI